jgi:hypothetical protein
MTLPFSLFCVYALAASGNACEVVVVASEPETITKELWCDDHLAAKEDIWLVGNRQLSSDLCEFRFGQRRQATADCDPSLLPYCGRDETTELVVYMFARSCEWSAESRTFSLSEDVTPNEVPLALESWSTAIRIISNPEGYDWSSPMQMLEHAQHQDIVRIGRSEEHWYFEVRACLPRKASDCSTVAMSVRSSPRSLDDIRVNWVD